MYIYNVDMNTRKCTEIRDDGNKREIRDKRGMRYQMRRVKLCRKIL